MRLSYNNLLLHLAQDYNNVLLHHTSFRSNYSHQNRSSFIERKKRKREEESKEHELREIEELIVVVLFGRGGLTGIIDRVSAARGNADHKADPR